MCNIDDIFSTKIKDILPPIARIIIIINKNITVIFLVFPPPFNYSNPGIKIILQKFPTPYYSHPSIIRYSRVSK